MHFDYGHHRRHFAEIGEGPGNVKWKERQDNSDRNGEVKQMGIGRKCNGCCASTEASVAARGTVAPCRHHTPLDPAQVSEPTDPAARSARWSKLRAVIDSRPELLSHPQIIFIDCFGTRSELVSDVRMHEQTALVEL